MHETRPLLDDKIVFFLRLVFFYKLINKIHMQKYPDSNTKQLTKYKLFKFVSD